VYDAQPDVANLFPEVSVHSDRIEQELEIDAPIEVVWRLITHPAHITAWFTDTAELDVRPGGLGRFGWTDKATSRAATVNVQVVTVDEPHLFAFRWDFPDAATPDESNAPLVEFILERAGRSTRLKLVESGLGAVDRSEESRAAYFAEHAKGWPQICARLQACAVDSRDTAAA
jgi:uncharacterized protein YndB with AHSA1/START domain